MLSSQTRADYFDVTLVGDDSKYNLAHKVVLATSSAKRVHPHPLVNFDIATFRFRNFLVSKPFHVFLWYDTIKNTIGIGFEKKLLSKKSIGIGFDKFWYRKKFRYWFRKNLVSKKVSVLVSEKFWYRKKYRYWYRKKIGIEKSIGIGIEKNWYRKKVSDSVSFRFWVSSHTDPKEHICCMGAQLTPMKSCYF